MLKGPVGLYESRQNTQIVIDPGSGPREREVLGTYGIETRLNEF